MSDRRYKANKRRLKSLQKYKEVTIWSKFLFDKLGLFWLWSRLVNKVLRIRGIKKEFGHEMIYRQYSKVFRHSFSSPLDSDGQRRVLFFFAMGSESTYNARNLMLAKFFDSKGWRSEFLICDGVFDICHKERIGKTRNESKFICFECKYGYHRISEETGMTYHRLSKYLPVVQSRLIDVYNIIERDLNSINECESYVFGSYNLGECVKASVLRFHYTGSILRCDLNIYKRYIREGVKCVLLFEEYFRNESHDLVILWNGAGFMDRLCSEVCRKLNVPFVTQESFWGSSSWIFKLNGIAIHLDYRSEYMKYGRDLELDEVSNRKLDDLLTSFRGINVKDIGISIWNQLGLQPNEEYIVLYTNMNFDTYVLGRDTIFESMTDWLLSTVDYIKQSNSSIKLVVRAHPGELTFVTPTSDFVRDSMDSVINDRIVFVDADSKISSYDILEGASSVLVYSSTIGVEAILAGKPTVCAGSTFYDDFVVKPKTRSDYFKVIDSVMNHSLVHNVSIHELRKYLYFLYFNRIFNLEGFGIDRSTGKDYVDTSYTAQDLLSLNRDVLERFYTEVITTDEN